MSLHLLRVSTSCPTLLRCKPYSFAGHILFSKEQFNKRISQDFFPKRHLSITRGFADFHSYVCNHDLVFTLQDKLINAHQVWNIPWWLVIVSTCFTFRICLLPIVIYQHKMNGRFALILEELNTIGNKTISESIKIQATKENWNQEKINEEYFTTKYLEKTKLIEEYNCHPAKNTILIALQMPIWMGVSASIRNITRLHPVADEVAQLAYSDMQQETFLWISDLTIPDSTYTLPIILSTSQLLNVYLNSKTKKIENDFFSKIIRNFFYAFSIYIGVIGSSVSSSICLYWVSSSLYGLIQNTLLLTPSVRRLLKIPTPKNLRLSPHKFVKKRLESFLTFLKY